METFQLLLIVLGAIAILLFLVIRVRMHAFLALMLVSLFTGAAAGMEWETLLKSVELGMGGILGFVAIIIGVGAIFGQILESTGGAQALAREIIRRVGLQRSEWALTFIGFLLSIPIFLDVAFIILVPLVYSLARTAKRSTLYYAIPLLAGLAVTHTFVPPTPGPVAVADLLGAPLGLVIIFGVAAGIPAAIVAGPLFGRYIARRIYLAPPAAAVLSPEEEEKANAPVERGLLSTVTAIILLPLLLIVLRTSIEMLLKSGALAPSGWASFLMFLGHPFTALIAATFIAGYFLGTRRGFTRAQLLELANRALGPAGLIILVTGAGGVFKQILVDSGIGASIAGLMAGSAVPPLLLAWLLAAVIRVTQGSATVAMITAAGMMAPLLDLLDPTDIQRAMTVTALAAGACILSHVNDSGFWLVNKYLYMTEKQTLQSWTVMETLVSVVGLAAILLFGLVWW
jgi:Gnt-I system low-affinity gluconate transporter